MTNTIQRIAAIVTFTTVGFGLAGSALAGENRNPPDQSKNERREVCRQECQNVCSPKLVCGRGGQCHQENECRNVCHTVCR